MENSELKLLKEIEYAYSRWEIYRLRLASIANTYKCEFLNENDCNSFKNALKKEINKCEISCKKA